MSDNETRGSQDRSIRVFTGYGSWIGDVAQAGTDLSPVEREARLLAWLRQNGYSLPNEYIEVLSLCDSASELRFVLPIIMLPEWTRTDERSFTNGTYQLSLQVPFLQYRLDFLLSGGQLPSPCNIEVDGPAHRRPDVWRRDRERDRCLMHSKIGVYRIAAECAKEEGQKFRKNFALEIRDTVAVGNALVVKGDRKRVWPRIPEALCLEDEPIEERPALVTDWLSTRGISVDDKQASFLSWCDRGAEILFLQPLISRPGWRPLGPRTYTDGVSFLTLKEQLGKYRVDIMFEQPGLSPGDDDLLLVADVAPPSYFQRNSAAELLRGAELVDAGYGYKLVELYEYHEVSATWGRWIDWARARWEEPASRQPDGS